MTTPTRKFNPGFLEDADIVSSFCVRLHEYDSIICGLREMPSSIGSHTLVIGPRGSGKTHLLHRIAAQVRREADSLDILPVLLAEESYEVTNCGEFWLECLRHLAEQTEGGWGERLQRSHDDFTREFDDRLLELKSLGALLDFADEHERRLLLVVENLDMVFENMADVDAGWRIRKTLQSEPRILLLGSATGRFAEIDSYDRALYCFFNVITLRPLGTAECRRLWESAAGARVPGGAIRPLEILTDGNPRLLTIAARSGGGRPVRELKEILLDLVDEHTEHFKSQLDALPTQERRVYLALARLWKPASAKEVSGLARLGSSKCSALLNRLAGRGLVSMAREVPGRNTYMLSERLFSIYYLLRRSGGQDAMVTALVEFMTSFYSQSEIDGALNDSPAPYGRRAQPAIAPCARTLVRKIVDLADAGKTINEQELNLLLGCLVEAGPLPPYTVRALMLDAHHRGFVKTLAAISESNASRRLTPLIAALRDCDGQSTRYSPEIEAVAEDVRGELRRLKRESGQSNPLPSNRFGG